MIKNKEVLIGIIGTSPQIITETLFFYSHPYYNNIRNFDKIIILTTSIGKKQIIENLFKRKILSKMESDLNLKKRRLNFSKKDIIVFKDSEGNDIEDIRSTSDNLDSMNIIFNTIRNYSNNPNTRITATYAGGRKSMTSMMSLAFQMLCTLDDELIHIMVPDKKINYNIPNNDPGKWYYPKDPKNKDEKIEISILPVLKIGNFLPIGKNNKSYEKILFDMQNYIIDSSSITHLHVTKNIFKSDNEYFKLQPMYASYLCYLIKKRKESTCFDDCMGCLDCFVNFNQIMYASQKEILQEHKRISGSKNQHYILKRNCILEYNSNNIKLGEQELGQLGLKARNRQDLSRLRSAYNKINNISIRFKKSLEIKEKRIDRIKYIGLILINKKNIIID